MVPPEAADGEKKTKKKKKDGGGSGAVDGLDSGSNVRSNFGVGQIRIGGYVFARGDLLRLDQTTVDSTGVPVTRDVNTLDLSIPSARFRIDYQSPWEWLTSQLEVDFAGNVDLRDAYVQAKGKQVAFRMGQFKMPVLAMQMESPWVLPLVRRGLIHDLTVDWLDVAGRLPGAMLTLREKFGDIKPKLFLGAFQASRFVEIDLDGSRDTDLVRERSLSSQKLVARGQVDIGSVEIGAVVRAPDRLAGVQPAAAAVDRGRRRDGQPRVRDRRAEDLGRRTGGRELVRAGRQAGRRQVRDVRHGARAGGLSLRRRRARGALHRAVCVRRRLRSGRGHHARTWSGKRRQGSTSDSSVGRA